MTPTASVTAPAAGPPPQGAPPPGAPPGAPPFEEALAEHLARTAQSEGREEKGEGREQAAPAQDPHTRPGGRHAHDATAVSQAGQVQAAAVAAAQTPAVAVAQAPLPSAEEAAPATEAQSSLPGGSTGPQGQSIPPADVTTATPLGASSAQTVTAPAATTQPSLQPAVEDPAGPHGAQARDDASGGAPPARASGTEARASTALPTAGASSAGAGAAAVAQGSAASAPEQEPLQPGSGAPLDTLTAGVQHSAGADSAASQPGDGVLGNEGPQGPPAPAGSGTPGTPAGPPPRGGVSPTQPHGDQPRSAQSGPAGSAAQAQTEPAPTAAGARGSHATGQLAGHGESPASGAGRTAGGEPPAAPAPAGAVEPGGAQEAPQLGAGVEMQDMVDAIRATVQLATREGISHARIALQPEELGDIRIHLTQTSDGLLARVTADSPAAAQALAGARAELHRSLSGLGTSLLRLDIGSPGQQQEQRRSETFAGRAAAHGASPATGQTPEAGAAEPAAAPAARKGTLLDVLA